MLLSLNTVGTDKPSMEGRRLAITAVLFLLLLGLGLWFFQLAIIRYWQHELHHKLEQVKTKQIVSAPKQQKPLMISNITLPALPMLLSIQATGITVATSTKASEPTKTQPVKLEPKVQRTQGVKVGSKPDAQTILQQLQSPKDVDLQIALPQNSAQRERLLDYLYRCGGAQFAVLKQQQLVFLSPKRYVPTSQWLRVVSGSLSAQENAWLAGHQGKPVRLFPQGIDQRLASYIATALQGDTLRSLRAQYTLSDLGLTLSHIKLNQQLITNPWLLHQSQCR